jgi:hypothetical protein
LGVREYLMGDSEHPLGLVQVIAREGARPLP